jgi:hypothetical protein
MVEKQVFLVDKKQYNSKKWVNDVLVVKKQ